MPSRAAVVGSGTIVTDTPAADRRAANRHPNAPVPTINNGLWVFVGIDHTIGMLLEAVKFSR